MRVPLRTRARLIPRRPASPLTLAASAAAASAVAAASPLANRMEEPSTEKSAAFPVHPGAAAYLDGDEESFLDKYSDLIYIGAMLMSVLASAAAALACRMTAANHQHIKTVWINHGHLAKRMILCAAPQ